MSQIVFIPQWLSDKPVVSENLIETLADTGKQDCIHPPKVMPSDSAFEASVDSPFTSSLHTPLLSDTTVVSFQRILQKNYYTRASHSSLQG